MDRDFHARGERVDAGNAHAVEAGGDDIRQGYVSLERAAMDYGVIIDPETMTVDDAATQSRRKEMDA
jgi:hypothetical protein